MSEALYRTYRPDTFKDVVGQEHVVSVLEQAIKDSAVSHAYLFAGTRGTGKTSIARIFAKGLDTSTNDIYEIDAASNRGIDDVRELRDGVHVLPFESKYKVYIIDEVHMLTKEAFNALLKTLEEPPQHALFILATTEIHKLPDTIVSRCQTFNFKTPPRSTLSDVAESVAKKEGYTLEKGVAELIATLGDGSFRDTLGVLQKVLTSNKDKHVSVVSVEEITGAPKKELVQSIVSALHTGAPEEGISAIHKAREQHIDMRLLLTLILQRVRAVLLLRYAKDMQKHLEEEFSDDEFKTLEELSKDSESKINSNTVLELLKAYEYLDVADIAGLPIELALIRLSE